MISTEPNQAPLIVGLTLRGETQVLRLGRHMMAGVIMTALCRHYASAVMHAVESIMSVFGVKLFY